MDLLSTSHFVPENDFIIMETMEEEGQEEEEEEDVKGEEEDEETHGSMEARTEDDLYDKELALHAEPRPAWVPNVYSKVGREVHYYAGQEIIIQESIDSYGAMACPAALALSKYLETHCEQVSLLDKAVLDLGAGTGLQSIVAALLGAWVTATDLPEIMGNLRLNLSKNTRGRCRHPPQVEELSWGPDLERTYPRSVYHYDYVLAADVVYHHKFLEDLLVTMKHFCQPGTTLIWANKVRFATDLTFTENFKKAFHTTVLAEDEEMKIFMATSREGETKTDPVEGIQDGREGEQEERESEEERRGEDEEARCNKKQEEDARQTANTVKEDQEQLHYTNEEEETNKEAEVEQTAVVPVWAPTCTTRRGRDIYHYAGEEIDIHESLDSFGAVMWPAALALCHFLDTNRLQLDLRGKEVLELGSGTGLVAIVASLLGAAVTATDLLDVLVNLKSNLIRNTRGRCRHTPQVEELSWGHGLERNYPRRVYHYDYVLAADVVYHHEFLEDLLVTMKHFCQQGTTLIWANKVRFDTDLTFTENFKKAFHTTVLAEDEEMKIFMATSR